MADIRDSRGTPTSDRRRSNCITITFIVAWIVLYVLLVRVFKLDKIAWKRADYAWIALTSLGIYGAVQTVRIGFANDKLSLATTPSQAFTAPRIPMIDFGVVGLADVRSQLLP